MKNLLRTISIHVAVAAIAVACLVIDTPAQTRTVLQDEAKTLPVNVYGIGANISLATGAGFSFRHHLANSPFSYMVTGYGWKSSDELSFDYGLELQYDFYLRENTRFYGLAGASYFYDWLKDDQSSFDPSGNFIPNRIRHNKLAGPTRIGAGVGYEISLGSSVGMYLNITATSYQPEGSFNVYPFGGMHVYFK